MNITIQKSIKEIFFLNELIEFIPKTNTNNAMVAKRLQMSRLDETWKIFSCCAFP